MDVLWGKHGGGGAAGSATWDVALDAGLPPHQLCCPPLPHAGHAVHTTRILRGWLTTHALCCCSAAMHAVVCRAFSLPAMHACQARPARGTRPTADLWPPLWPLGLERIIQRNPSYDVRPLLEGVGVVLSALVGHLMHDATYLLGRRSAAAAGGRLRRQRQRPWAGRSGGGMMVAGGGGAGQGLGGSNTALFAPPCGCLGEQAR